MNATQNGFENIKEKIIADAESQAKEILANAEAEAQKIFDVKADDANKHKAEGMEKIKLSVKLYEDKELAQARLKAKRLFLEEREKLLNELISDFTTKFDRKGLYPKFLEKILKSNKNLLSGMIVITCDTKDKALVEKLVKKTNYAKSKVQTTPMNGGIILEDDSGKRVNESLENILEMKKREVRNKLAQLI